MSTEAAAATTEVTLDVIVATTLVSVWTVPAAVASSSVLSVVELLVALATSFAICATNPGEIELELVCACLLLETN